MPFKPPPPIWKALIPITAFVILLILNPQYLRNSQETPQNLALHPVSRVVDGDTIRIIKNNQEEVVRLVNMNAPESVDPRRPVECMGEEASEMMAQLVDGKKVRLEEDETQSSRDRYQRLLRFVFLEDGTDVGREMIRLGYAYSTPYGRSPHKYLQEYELAQEEAIELERGLWDPNACSDQDRSTTEQKILGEISTTNKPFANQDDFPSGDQEKRLYLGAVRKSSSSICHLPGTTYYERIINYKTYNSLSDCLAAGGRLPKR